jgi:RecB family exonuclease
MSQPGPLSPSQVDNYLQCAYRWYCASILKLPQPVTVSLAIGRAVHRTITAALADKVQDRHRAASFALTSPSDGREWPEVIQDLAHDFAQEELAHVPVADSADPEIHEERATEAAALADKIEAMCQLWWRIAAPSIEPAMLEQEVSGEIGGIPVVGIVDILDIDGKVIDLKTARAKPAGVSPRHALQLSTYTMLVEPGKIGRQARIDTLTKAKQPGFYSHTLTIDDDQARFAERIYPMVAEAIGDGLYLPNRGNESCSRKHCPFWQSCEAEFGGTVKP